MRNVTNEKIIAIMINIDIVKDKGISKGAFLHVGTVQSQNR